PLSLPTTTANSGSSISSSNSSTNTIPSSWRTGRCYFLLRALQVREQVRNSSVRLAVWRKACNTLGPSM
uniref:Uncharacterized protein n=1 Tax=Anopheles albimanus TaxID=7167 RepID=A0A182FYB4_ANOAL